MNSFSNPNKSNADSLIMSRMTFTGSRRDPKPDPLAELDIDELVERLTPGEIQRLLDECDPDDPHIPPSMRCNYKCEKAPTGPLDRKKLQDFINEQVRSDGKVYLKQFICEMSIFRL